MSIPSRELLPEYMKTDRWLQLADAIDEVFGIDLDLQAKMLKYLRYQFIESEAVKQKVADGVPINFSAWDMPDVVTAAEQVEVAGLRFYDSSYMTRNRFVSLYRNIGDYWYSKGKVDFVNFIGYVMNSKVEVINLWTQDYKTFVPEDELTYANSPVYNFGTWYPTTHVRLRADGASFEAGTPNVIFLAQLFLDIANYTLVLDALEEYFDTWITTEGTTPTIEGQYPADIVALGLVLSTEYNILAA
jgi:hypothetical protein